MLSHVIYVQLYRWLYHVTTEILIEIVHAAQS